MERILNLEHRVERPLPQVFEILSDLREFGRHHPYFEDVEQIGPDSYRVHEFAALQFTPIHHDPRNHLHSGPSLVSWAT